MKHLQIFSLHKKILSGHRTCPPPERNLAWMGTCDITYCPASWVPSGLQRFSPPVNLHIQGIHGGTYTATPPLLSNSILCCICILNASSFHQAPHPQQIQVPDWESLWICEDQDNEKKRTVYMRKPKRWYKERKSSLALLIQEFSPWTQEIWTESFIIFQFRNVKLEAGAGMVVFTWGAVWPSTQEFHICSLKIFLLSLFSLRSFSLRCEMQK